MSATEADASDADDGSEASNESKTPEELTTVIRAEVLQQVVDQVLSVADEAVFHIGREGLEVAVVDPANVAMVDIEVGPEAFEKVGDGMFPIGVNIQKLDNYIDGASGSDPVTLAYIPETRMLNIQHTNVDIEMAAIDPDAIRKEPDPPEMEHPAEFKVGASAFVDALKNADLATDQVDFIADVEDERMTVLGSGDVDDVRTNFGEEELTHYDFEKSLTSLYSLEYFLSVTSPMPRSVGLTVTFGHEMPMIIEYAFADGYGEVLIMIAPRVDNTR